MTIQLNPEALYAVKALCFTVCTIVVCNTFSKLIDLRRSRRRDALFERLANEAMASGRPCTFTNESIKRS